MDMKECPKGHFYDGDLNASCPECEMEKQRNYGNMGAAGAGFDEVGATEPVGGSFGSGFDGGFDGAPNGFDAGFTEAPDGFGNNSGAKTKAPDQPFGGGETMRFYDSSDPGADHYSDQTMNYSPGRVAGFTPVVGWLVCVEGPDRGSDYRIRTGYNHIGRAEHMDICVRGDKQISREKHALIAFDSAEKVFFFGPSEGRNIVRINDRMVMMPTELEPYDIVTVGSSKMIFVPLCGEHFDWEK